MTENEDLLTKIGRLAGKKATQYTLRQAVISHGQVKSIDTRTNQPSILSPLTSHTMSLATHLPTQDGHRTLEAEVDLQVRIDIAHWF